MGNDMAKELILLMMEEYGMVNGKMVNGLVEKNMQKENIKVPL